MRLYFSILTGGEGEREREPWVRPRPRWKTKPFCAYFISFFFSLSPAFPSQCKQAKIHINLQKCAIWSSKQEAKENRYKFFFHSLFFHSCDLSVSICVSKYFFLHSLMWVYRREKRIAIQTDRGDNFHTISKTNARYLLSLVMRPNATRRKAQRVELQIKKNQIEEN